MSWMRVDSRERTLVQETTTPRRKRTLRSDFLLVRYPEDTHWQAFRDVAEVDGKPVRDHDARLTKLFLEPPERAPPRQESSGGQRPTQSAQHRYGEHSLIVVACLQDSTASASGSTSPVSTSQLGPTVTAADKQL